MKDKVKQSAGALIGNSMQFYDFTIFAFLTPQLSQYFFSIDNDFLSYFITILVFSSGYITRPLGALIFGHIGDKFGRSVALSKTIILSTIATFIIGILPSYSTLGYLSPILLIVFRLLQGLSVSGEEGGSVVLLYEKNNFKNKGSIGGLVLSSVLFGVILGSLVCIISTYLISSKIIGEWGWRIPFLFSLPFGIVAIKLRYRINDLKSFSRNKEINTIHQIPLVELVSKHLNKIILSVLIVSTYSLTTSALIVNFPYLIKKVGFTQELSLGLVALTVMLIGILSPIFGKKFEKHSWKLAYISTLLMLILISPIIFLLISTGKYWLIILALFLFSIPTSSLSALVFMKIVDIFPFGVRYSSVSLAFNLSITIFSSTTPVVLAYLENKYSYVYSGGYISLFSLTIILFVIFLDSNNRSKYEL